MLSDFGRFTGYVYRRLTPHREAVEAEFPTESAVQGSIAQSSTQAPKAANNQTLTED